MKVVCKKLDAIANKLGFGEVLSYSKLYKTVINTYGRRDASMWFFTISLNDLNQVVGVEVNSTYFKPTKKILELRKVATFDTPLDLDAALELVSLKN